MTSKYCKDEPQFINLTSHPIIIRRENMVDVIFDPEVSRMNCPRIRSPKVDFTEKLTEFEVNHYLPYETVNLPHFNSERRVYYIVSRDVAQYNPLRPDLIFPDTTKRSAIRNENGVIVAVRGFASYCRDYISRR